jgi:hypothetical protein
MSMTSRGDCIVAHREYVGDIAGSVGFANASYHINPGLNILFPWLAGIAASYEQYKFRRLRFMYTPLTSTATVGQFIMGVDYDAADPPALTKAELQQYDGVYAGPSWQPGACVFQTDRLFARRLFTRQYFEPAQDAKTFDSGLLQVATQGFSGTSTIGELWVEYEIELFVPQPPAHIKARHTKFHSTSGLGTLALVKAGSSPTALSNISVSVLQAGNDVGFGCPEQNRNYIFCYYLVGTTMVTGSPIGVDTGHGISIAGGYSVVNSTGTACIGWFYVNSGPDELAYFIPYLTSSASVTASDWWIMDAPSAIDVDT